jgi:hypothetical protein
MKPVPVAFVVLLSFCFLRPGTTAAEEIELTPNVPIPEFQNKAENPSYDFNAPPRGLFLDVQLAEGFEHEIGFRQSHDVVPVRPTDRFGPQAVVYIVFSTHQHYNAFQVSGRCYPEQVDGLDPKVLVAEDAMYIALEDNSGYIQLNPPPGGWKPGRYKVEMHIGFQVNEISLVGTMRFTVPRQSGAARSN